MKFTIPTLIALLLAPGCKFREPDPSEAVYQEAVAAAEPRPPLPKLRPVAPALEPEKNPVPVPAAPEPAALLGQAFTVQHGPDTVAWRPNGDYLRLGPKGLRGRVAGRCLAKRGRVVFPCTQAEAASVATEAAAAPGLASLPRAAADLWEQAAQVADGFKEELDAPNQVGVCLGHDGPLSGIGPVVARLTEVTSRSGAPVDERAGVMVESLRLGTWRVCLILSAIGPGAITIRRGPVKRLWHRGSYWSIMDRAPDLGSGHARVFLYLDPESVGSEADLVAAIEMPR